MLQVHIFVTGRVQGVGYRRFVRYHARKLGLTGWVQNLPDRRVEAVLQGPKEQIVNLLKLCKKGPLLAEVTAIQEDWQEITEQFPDFEIRRPQ